MRYFLSVTPPPPTSTPSFPTQGLRPMIVPNKLVPEFLRIASPNSMANIETCGILLGTMVSACICPLSPPSLPPPSPP